MLCFFHIASTEAHKKRWIEAAFTSGIPGPYNIKMGQLFIEVVTFQG